ncbi:MAG: hypothetical protein RI995_1258, partial [Bacteroidota bacterium]
MKKLLTILFVFSIISLNAQKIDV